ncbi:MAG: molybdopterin molybdotransferase MoeA [Phycisphaerae bacterium]|nr:molybdopterin molybdotransferase MoeA [Phycisphaerae bacterium]
MVSPTDQFKSPHDALAALLARIEPVGVEQVDSYAAAGRVLAEPLVADRDSPAHDVSAMDGYALRLADLPADASWRLEVAGEIAAGQPPRPLPVGRAMRVFTGACIPTGADVVVRREDVDEDGGSIAVSLMPGAIRSGDYIRRRGENAREGQSILPPGIVVTPPAAGALVAFGAHRPMVYRRVRVGVLITGDEVLGPGAVPEPWQIRDANGPALLCLLATLPWVEVAVCDHSPDDLEALTLRLRELLACCDAVLVSGGVSMGDRDHVPAAAVAAGADCVFHKLPTRPGRPLLAAVGPAGQPILGLPGNPVSVLVTAHRFALPALRRRAGWITPEPPCSLVHLIAPDGRTLHLWWYRPVRLTGPGIAELVPHISSGDLAGPASSDGFIEIPPTDPGRGAYPFRPW